MTGGAGASGNRLPWRGAAESEGIIVMKNVIRLELPPMRSYFCGRRPSAVAVAACRRGNAAGAHGRRARCIKRERRASRLEERAARMFQGEAS